MDALTLTFEAEPDPAIAGAISDGVDSHVMDMTGVADWQPVGLVLRAAEGDLAGGLTGYVWAGWLDIKYLWIAEAHRGQGWGSRLLAEAEAFAVKHGARSATLDTHNPAARALYERLGYRVVGVLEDFPPGFSKTLMRKDFP
jgi:ribosomal protein S18 acetylase RimI-like enzyme